VLGFGLQSKGLNSAPTRNQVVETRFVRIGHSQYSEPRFVIEGSGPASSRSHFTEYRQWTSARSFHSSLSIASREFIITPGETEGIPMAGLPGKSIADVWRDDVSPNILILGQTYYL
jgi:hypothetical protein